MLFGGFGRVRAGVTLVHIGQFHDVSGHLLHLFGHGCDLFAIAMRPSFADEFSNPIRRQS